MSSRFLSLSFGLGSSSFSSASALSAASALAAASPTFRFRMGKRSEKRVRVKHWCIYFPTGPQARTCTRTLLEVVDAGQAGVTLRVVSKHKVELVWKNAVTLASATRLVGLAKKRSKAFRILGEPKGIVDLDLQGELLDALPKPYNIFI